MTEPQKKLGGEDATVHAIGQAIFDKKGFNILALDVRNVSTMADYFIIAEGSVERHVAALGQEVEHRLKEQLGLKPLHIDGQSYNDWLVLDYGDVVVHLFIPEMRERYSIEEIWREGRVVDLNIETSLTPSKA